MNRTLKLVYCALGAVILAICSWITIPTVIPFTLQTLGVFALLLIFGGKLALGSICLFMALGAVGVPVFSGFKAGVGVLIGTTGGYIVGFVFIAIIYMFSVKLFGEKLLVKIIALVIGLLVCYAFGTAWFIIVYAKSSGAIGVGSALSWCVIPFIIPDLCKLAAAVLISKPVKKAIHIQG